MALMSSMSMSRISFEKKARVGLQGQGVQERRPQGEILSRGQLARGHGGWQAHLPTGGQPLGIGLTRLET